MDRGMRLFLPNFFLIKLGYLLKKSLLCRVTVILYLMVVGQGDLGR